MELRIIPQEDLPISRKRKRGRPKLAKSWERDDDDDEGSFDVSIAEQHAKQETIFKNIAEDSEEDFDYDAGRIMFHYDGMDIMTFV